jgi:hypothetical protein
MRHARETPGTDVFFQPPSGTGAGPYRATGPPESSVSGSPESISGTPYAGAAPLDELVFPELDPPELDEEDDVVSGPPLTHAATVAAAPKMMAARVSGALGEAKGAVAASPASQKGQRVSLPRTWR